MHAAFDFAVAHPAIVQPWSQDSNYLVVVEAPNQEAILALADRAWDAGIAYSVVTEPDYDNETTALVLEPGLMASRLCAQLPLAMKETVIV